MELDVTLVCIQGFCPSFSIIPEDRGTDYTQIRKNVHS